MFDATAMGAAVSRQRGGVPGVQRSARSTARAAWRGRRRLDVQRPAAAGSRECVAGALRRRSGCGAHLQLPPAHRQPWLLRSDGRDADRGARFQRGRSPGRAARRDRQSEFRAALPRRSRSAHRAVHRRLSRHQPEERLDHRRCRRRRPAALAEHRSRARVLHDVRAGHAAAAGLRHPRRRRRLERLARGDPRPKRTSSIRRWRSTSNARPTSSMPA